MILLNSVLNWLEEFLENVSARRSAMAFLPVILWFVKDRCFKGGDCFLSAIFRIMSQTILMLEEVFCQDFFIASLIILRALAR